MMGQIRQGVDRGGYALGHCARTGPRKRTGIGASEGEGGADASWCCLGAKSLAGAEVECGDGKTVVAEKDIPRFKTDADELAEVPIVNAGPHLQVIDHKSGSLTFAQAGQRRYVQRHALVRQFKAMNASELGRDGTRALLLRVCDDAPAQAKEKTVVMGGLLLLPISSSGCGPSQASAIIRCCLVRHRSPTRSAFVMRSIPTTLRQSTT